jgi:ubiquinone/menaquinone biosynthesis C-methylase UbiE
MAKAVRYPTKSEPALASLLSADRVCQESLRLLLQAALYDPLTSRFLLTAGLREGMRVLDVGSGLGSVTLLVSEIVGPQGEVVGIECSQAMVEFATRRMRNAGKTNTQFVLGRAESLQLDGPFDAVVGRFVLRELDNRAATLEKLSRLLRPGGIVAFQEKILTVPVTAVPSLPAVEKARAWMDRARALARVELEMGAKLPQIFAAAGLPAPELRLEAPIGNGTDWVGYDYLVEMVRGMLPAIRLYGIANERELRLDTLADEMRSEGAALGSVVILTPCVGAWTTRRAENRRRRRRS